MKRLCLPVLLVACGQHIAEPWDRDRTGGVRTVRVTTRGDRGTRARPLPFSDEGVDLTLSVAVFDASDQPLTTFDGTLTLSASPGSLVAVSSPGAIGNVVRLRAGRVDDVAVRIARAYGETRLWAEDTGYAPVDPRRSPLPACADGRDNDGDGFADFPGDVGCEAPNDDEERGGSFAVGTSEAIFFATPLLADVQGRGAQSPLVDQRVTVLGRTELTPAPAGESAHSLQQHCAQYSESRPKKSYARHRRAGGETVSMTGGVGCLIPLGLGPRKREGQGRAQGAVRGVADLRGRELGALGRSQQRRDARHHAVGVRGGRVFVVAARLHHGEARKRISPQGPRVAGAFDAPGLRAIEGAQRHRVFDAHAQQQLPRRGDKRPGHRPLGLSGSVRGGSCHRGPSRRPLSVRRGRATRRLFRGGV
jgi:hypothetical protein